MNKKTTKTNYLLIMPRLIQNKGDGYSFPLGIAYISANMKKAGRNVFTVNLNHRDGNIVEILNDLINKHHIHVVATGGLSFQYNTVKDVIEAAKKANPEIITIVGGGLITGDPEPAMRALEKVDYGVIGEGDITINELCDCIEKDCDPKKVDGLIFKENGSYVFTTPRKEFNNIDDLPWPDYEGFDIARYIASTPPGISGLNEHNTIFMLASRSCPYNCTFCFHTVGKKYRQRSLENFFEELDYMTSQYKIKFICLADELFARDINRVREFCKKINTYNIRWWAQFRVDDITPEIIPILKEGGCEIMSFGLESADNRILKSMRKHTTVEMIEQTLKMVYESGISLEGAFIFGDKEETAETAQNTMKWWREHSQYRINLNLITVYPGAELYHYAVRQGIIKDKVKFLKEGCPQINVSKMSDEELSHLIAEITEAPLTQTKTLNPVTLIKTDYSSGRINISSECSTCGEQNLWENVKLFTTNFLPCKKCGQKYNVPYPPEIMNDINLNVKKLTEKYGEIAIWAINFNTLNMFKNCPALMNENIYPVDISETKRKMTIYGKKIFSPHVITEKKIKAVVIAIPAFYTQIETQLKNHYNDVNVIIDVCELINPAFKS